MVKISIIMPLYNAENYLEECLKSVQMQTFTDYELICVNDASTDATLEMIEKFRQTDDRIQIYSNTERSGAAYSRNYGIKKAQGDYLTFLDGDDIYEEEMLECAYAAAETYHTDVVMYERMHVPSRDIYRKRQVFHGEMFRDRYCKSVFEVKDHMPHEFLNWALGPGNKLYRRRFIQDNGIEFQNLSCANDIYFSCMVLLLSPKTILLNDNRVMVYARDHDEPSRISYMRDPMCSFQAFVHLAEELIKREKFSEVYPNYYYKFYHAVVNALLQCKTEEKRREFYQFLQTEGICKICDIGVEYYDRLDHFIKGQIEQFINKDFDTKWYRRQEGLNMWLSQECLAASVIDLFQKYKDLHKSVGIWGAGANGASLLRFCRKNDLRVDMVVDRSREKQGQTIEGYQVKAPDEIDHNLQVFLVTPRYIFESVEEELEERNIEVVDINQFLGIY